MTDTQPDTVVQSFINAFDAADLDGIAGCLSENLVAEVPQKDDSTIELHGRAAYMANIEALDIPTIRPSAKVTQIARVGLDQVLVMVEIRAKRKGRVLHNHAAYLMTVAEGRIARIWMVEALPEESDSFWKT